jgi:hypothetical protein
MKTFTCFLSALIVAYCSSSALSAPMIPTGPMDIEGTIEEVTWQPGGKLIKGVKVKMNGKEVPMSGSLGVDRITRSKYSVRLTGTVVTKPAGENNPYYKSFPSGTQAIVTIYHDKDDGYMKKGMRIKVINYRIDGDEGGTWESYEKIDILNKL